MRLKTVPLLANVFNATMMLAFCGLAAKAQTFKASNTNFQSLYNEHRIGEPRQIPWAGSFYPYAGDGTAVKVASSPRGRSAMEAYDLLAGNTASAEGAYKWEYENHTCRKLKGDQKKSCESWWGHCNAWAAAALKHPEPRAALQASGVSGSMDLSVADQKGMLTEMWMSSNSLFVGNTDKGTKIGPWVRNRTENPEAYDAFWDVSPKTMFLTLTNYVGIQKMGLVIDRFTGDEVWNQPLAGYRILPLEPTDIQQVEKDGARYWAVHMTIKIYWANDLGTPPDYLTEAFSVMKDTSDSASLESLPESYEGRVLNFTLFIDQEVSLASDGALKTAGRLIGNGIWEHQEKVLSSLKAYNESHPDFIWAPTNPIRDTSGYGNPFVDPGVVTKVFGNRAASGNAGRPGNSSRLGREVEVRLKVPGFSRSKDAEFVAKRLQTFLARASLHLALNLDQARMSGDLLTVSGRLARSYSEVDVVNITKDLGIAVEVNLK